MAKGKKGRTRGELLSTIRCLRRDLWCANKRTVSGTTKLVFLYVRALGRIEELEKRLKELQQCL